MSKSDDQNEPSMEEILASIRRIISEEEPAEAAPDAAAAEDSAEDEIPPAEDYEELVPAESETGPSRAQGEPEEEILELTQKIADDGTIIDLRATLEPEPEAEFSAADIDALFDAPPASTAEEAQMSEAEAYDEGAADETWQEEADQAAASGDEALAEADPDESGLVPEGGRDDAGPMVAGLSHAEAVEQGAELLSDEQAIEAMVRDALMPELRDWLDRNLPRIVEEVVRDEVQKLARPAS